MIKRANQGKSSVMIVLVLSVVLSSSIALGIIEPEDVAEDFLGYVATFEEGLQIISNKSYELSTNLKWSDIKTAGVKISNMSINGFLQVCERLVLDLGNLKVYADFECRLLWVYSEANNPEVYYVQFN